LNDKSSPLFQGKQFPNEPLFSVEGSSENRYEGGNSDTQKSEAHMLNEIVPEPLYKTCAVIPNSAAFDGAKHGIDIGKRFIIEEVHHNHNFKQMSKRILIIIAQILMTLFFVSTMHQQLALKMMLDL